MAKFHKGPQKVSITDEDVFEVFPYIKERWNEKPLKVPKTLKKKKKKTVSKNEQTDNLKQKLILEAMVSSVSIGAWTVGSTLLMAGWAIGSVVTGFAGFAIFSGGVAWSLTGLTRRYDSIKSKVTAQVKEAKRAEEDRKLDELDQKLTLDKDPRDQDALRDLRTIHAEFEEFADQGKIPEHVGDTMRVRINELFDGCIKNLQICYDLWDTARPLRGKAREKLLQNREEILQDVIKSVESFTNVVTAVMTMSYKNGDLAGVSENLDVELAACLKVEQRLRSEVYESGIGNLGVEYEQYGH